MPTFAANLSMLFTERPFLDRFAAAAEAGFTAVEYLFPYDFPATEVAERLRAAGLTQALFNLPAGDWDAGDRGTAALPGREEEFRSAVDLALEYARALDCRQVHAMAGIAEEGDADAERTYVANIRYAADRAAQAGVTVLIEPINRRDMPGYFLGSVRQAERLLDEIDHDNVRLQFDLYHAQITDGDVTRLIERVLPRVAHVQIASVPERHEPDGGELSYPYVLAALDELGYAGWVGAEYRPAGETTAGLGWLRDFSASR